MSRYLHYRETVTALWLLNRMAMRAGARAVSQRIRRTPRRADWSLRYAGMVEFMTLGTPTDLPIAAEQIRDPLDRAAALARASLVTSAPLQTALWAGEWVAAPHARTDHVILYLHGGGYVSGSPRTHRALMGHLSRHTRARILALDYRLAPEHVFPSALEDAWAAYWWLLQQDIPPARIVVAGDSAGGGLTLALLLALREAGAPLPAGAICFSPWADLALTGASLHKNSATDYINAQVLRATAEMYLGGHDPRDPLASPLYADLHGLPPLLVQVGSAELLYDDGRRLAQRARRAGVDVHFEAYTGMVHVWQFMYLLEPKARQALRSAARFAHSVWGEEAYVRQNRGKIVGQAVRAVGRPWPPRRILDRPRRWPTLKQSFRPVFRPKFRSPTRGGS
jgi:acetyl esterase/lipase